MREKIQPALQRGEWVICDRFFDSTTVYQGVARHLDPGLVKRLNAFAIGDCIPDLTFVLDIDLATTHSRLDNRRKIRDRIEEESDEFYARDPCLSRTAEERIETRSAHRSSNIN